MMSSLIMLFGLDTNLVPNLRNKMDALLAAKKCKSDNDCKSGQYCASHGYVRTHTIELKSAVDKRST